jgi:hypothetical protein
MTKNDARVRYLTTGANPPRPSTFPQLLNPATIRLRRDDSDYVRDVVVEPLADREQPGAVVRAPNDAVAAQLAAQDLDLGFQEPDAGVAAAD